MNEGNQGAGSPVGRVDDADAFGVEIQHAYSICIIECAIPPNESHGVRKCRYLVKQPTFLVEGARRRSCSSK